MVKDILGTLKVKYHTYPDPHNPEKSEEIEIDFTPPWRCVNLPFCNF